MTSTPTPQNELGRAIKTARRAANLSQSETAAALGVRQSSVCQWERGNTVPKTKHLLQLLKLFGTTLTRLLVPEEATTGAAPERRHSDAASIRAKALTSSSLTCEHLPGDSPRYEQGRIASADSEPR